MEKRRKTHSKKLSLSSKEWESLVEMLKEVENVEEILWKITLNPSKRKKDGTI